MGRFITSGVLISFVIIGVASGQSQRPQATVDDLLAEIQAMRAEVNRAASASIRAQLLTARVTVQELRVSTAAQQLANVRQQLADSRIRLAPSTDQIKPAQDTSSQILAPLRHTVQHEQRRSRELVNQEAELTRMLDGEEQRWAEFNARLDDLERALSR